MAKSYLGATTITIEDKTYKVPRNIRNNNPGNIITTGIAWQGKIPLSKNTDTDKRFEQFTELRYGLRALMRQVNTDFSKGINTIHKFITKYAPAFENNTEAYINAVAGTVGISANTPLTLNTDTLLLVCKAIAMVEGGKIPDTNTYWSTYFIEESDYNEALSISGLPFKKKATPLKQ